MAIKSTLTQIEEVQAAITSVLNNQSYTIDGMAVSRAQLKALTEYEAILLDKYNRETNRNMPTVSQADMGGVY